MPVHLRMRIGSGPFRSWVMRSKGIPGTWNYCPKPRSNGVRHGASWLSRSHRWSRSVYVRLTDNWIELGLVYPVDNDVRRSFRSEISQQILTEFAAAGITVASQTVAIVQFPPGAFSQNTSN